MSYGSSWNAETFDGNGNIVSLINAADGTTAAEYAYGPFGEVIKAAGVAVASNPFGFSTKYQDTESGLLYYGMRYYQPSTGRWLSKDPIQEDGGENLYGFVGNDGINAFDTYGLWSASGVRKAFQKCKCMTNDELNALLTTYPKQQKGVMS